MKGGVETAAAVPVECRLFAHRIAPFVVVSALSDLLTIATLTRRKAQDQDRVESVPNAFLCVDFDFSFVCRIL